jgi:hypothetical protein
MIKSNSGMSLMEIVVGLALTGAVGYMSFESQSNTSKQVKAISVYETSSMLRELLLNLITHKSFVEGSFRGAEGNEQLRPCIPNSFDSENAKFTGLCNPPKTSGFAKVAIPMPTDDDKKNIGVTFGGLKPGMKNILSAGKVTYFDSNGRVCKNSDAPSCSIAAKAKLSHSCSSGMCGTNQGPDVIKIIVELKDHRHDVKDPTSGKAPRHIKDFDKKPTIYHFYALHDMSIIKEQKSESLDDESFADCDPITIDGYINQTGYPVKIEKGKMVCGYHDPNVYVGKKGIRGKDGVDGPRGNNGSMGSMGSSGSRGKSCTANRTGSGGCSGEGASTRCPKVWVVSC